MQSDSGGLPLRQKINRPNCFNIEIGRKAIPPSHSEAHHRKDAYALKSDDRPLGHADNHAGAKEKLIEIRAAADLIGAQNYLARDQKYALIRFSSALENWGVMAADVEMKSLDDLSRRSRYWTA